jgi:hypothetical protein
MLARIRTVAENATLTAAPRRTAGLLVLAAALSPAARSTEAPAPPPIDEAAFAGRLLEMAAPVAGERAILLYDPTYYPGVAERLRLELHRRGVQTYLLVEDSPEMTALDLADPARRERREHDVVATLGSLFDRADIFFWLPVRAYADDLRWERVVENSRVRSIHFHWLIPFPGDRDAPTIAEQSRDLERRSLGVDLEEHRRRQQRLVEALRGRTVRITSPSGTDLSVWVPDDQWFHRGDGDASRARAAAARSLRDREIELPVGMFNFVPVAATVDGVVVAARVPRAGERVREARLTLAAGRVTAVTAAAGAEDLERTFAEIGPDGNRIAAFWIATNPHSPATVTVVLGSNWENGGRNLAVGADRVSITLADATLTAGGRVLVERGQARW